MPGHNDAQRELRRSWQPWTLGLGPTCGSCCRFGRKRPSRRDQSWLDRYQDIWRMKDTQNPRESQYYLIDSTWFYIIWHAIDCPKLPSPAAAHAGRVPANVFLSPKCTWLHMSCFPSAKSFHWCSVRCSVTAASKSTKYCPLGLAGASPAMLSLKTKARKISYNVSMLLS